MTNDADKPNQHQKITLTICNKLGLHARASAKLAACTSAFDCDISLDKEGVAINGKSILGIMMLAAAKGTELTITVDGHDAAAALNAIQQLVENRFGEDE
ncbi:MAG: HPr family phosphocarrier protein [Mariprofundales bacterium]|nr:HPr family phosphocarrier protein [Mariprofundales bacterium]